MKHLNLKLNHQLDYEHQELKHHVLPHINIYIATLRFFLMFV
jgi:hypothetical protein